MTQLTRLGAQTVSLLCLDGGGLRIAGKPRVCARQKSARLIRGLIDVTFVDKLAGRQLLILIYFLNRQ